MPRKDDTRSERRSGRSTRKTTFRRFSKADHTRRLKQIKKYRRAYGAPDGEACREADPEFAGWYIHTRNRLAEMKWADVEKLIEHGFFDKKEERWLEHFRHLRIFKEVFGHTRVPARWPKNKALATWVHRHRAKDCPIRPHFRLMLSAIGFEWKLRDRAQNYPWEKCYAELAAYKRRYGNCDVPAKWPENKRLGGWVSTQRLNKHLLSDEQIAKLDELDFDWDILGNQWEARYRELVAFYEEHGHSRVPFTYAPNPGLGHWVGNVRRRRHAQTRERLRKLKAVEFVWAVDDETWESCFKRLAKYVKRHGDALVPALWSKDPSLGTWAVSQRQERKFGKLSEEKIERLDRLGFVWDVAECVWERRLEELRQFKDRFGHCRVPVKNWPENPELATWLGNLRTTAKWKKLEPKKRRQLEKLGVRPGRPKGPLPENVREYLRGSQS